MFLIVSVSLFPFGEGSSSKATAPYSPDPSPGASLCTGPRPEMFKLVHYEAHTLGEQAVNIRLIYLLVFIYYKLLAI